MKGQPEIGISTGIGFDRPIADVIDPIARAGFVEVEVSTAPHHLDVKDPKAVAAAGRALTDAGLRVVSLHAPFGTDVNFASPDEVQRRSSLDVMTRAADALADLGGRLYVVHPGGEDQRWTWDRERRLGYAADGLQRLWSECRDRGLLLVVESPLPHLLGGEPADFDRLIRQLPEEGTAVCVDTSHLSLGGHLETFMTHFASRLVHVQASDNRGRSDDHLPPGEGSIDWQAFFRLLTSVRYRGTLVLEVSGTGPVDERVSRAARSVARLRAALSSA